MHRKGYVHNDIKPDNILLDSDQEEQIFPVISDFGVFFISNTANFIKGFEVKLIKGATLLYASPKIIRSLILKSQAFSPTLKSDVYSIGILSVEILGRKKPWQNFDKRKVLDGERPRIEGSNIPEIIKNLIVKCWDDDPNVRPTMEEVYISYCSV
jgi:serine/threonine protein kinase